MNVTSVGRSISGLHSWLRCLSVGPTSYGYLRADNTIRTNSTELSPY
jgi:hypothetical protein